MKNVLIIVFIWIAGSIYFNSCNTKKKTADTVEHTTESNSTEKNSTHTLHTSTTISEEHSIVEKSDVKKSTLVENNLTFNDQNNSDLNLTTSVTPLSVITTNKEVLPVESNKTLIIGTKHQNNSDEAHSIEASQIKDHTSLVSKFTKDIDNNHTILITDSEHNIIVPYTIKSQKETKETLSKATTNIPDINTTTVVSTKVDPITVPIDKVKKDIPSDTKRSISSEATRESEVLSSNSIVTEPEMNISIPVKRKEKTIHTSQLTKDTKVIDTVGITDTVEVPRVMKVPQAIKAPNAITVTTLHKNNSNVLSLVYGKVKNTPNTTKESSQKILQEKVVTDTDDKTEERLKLNIEEIKRTAAHEKEEAIRLTKEKYEAQKIMDAKKVEEETKRLKLLHTTDVEKLSEVESKFQLFRKEKEQTIKENHDKFTALLLVKDTLEAETTKLHAKIKELQENAEQKQSQEALALAAQKEALEAEAKRIEVEKVELERLRNSEKEEITKLKMLHASDVQRLYEEQSKNEITAQENKQTIKDNLAKVAALMLARDALEKEKTEALNFKQNAQKDIDTLNQENDKLHITIKELQTKVQDETTQHLQEKERQAKITQETESKIKSVTEEKEKLKELIVTLKKKIAEQEATIAEKQSQEAKQLATQKAILENETKRIETEKADLEELLAYIEKEKTQLKTLQAKEIQTFTDEKAKYAQERQEKEETIKNNLLKISSLMSSYTQVEEEKNKEITLKQQFATQLESAQKEKVSLATKVQTLTEQNKKLTQQIQNLQTKNKKELERLTALKATLDEESQKITKSKSEIEKLRMLQVAEKTKLDTEVKELEDKKTMLLEVDKKLAQEKAEAERLAALKVTLDKKSQEIANAKSELENLRNTEAKEYKAACQKKEQLIKDNLAKLTALMLVKDKLETEKTKALQEKQESITQYSAEHEANLKAQSQAKMLADENAKLQATLQELQTNTQEEATRISQENAKQVEATQKAQAKIKVLAEEKQQLEEKLKLQKEAQEKEAITTKAKEKLFDIFALTHVEFKTNSPELTHVSKLMLNKAAKAIKEHTNFNYEIHGHTDSRGDKDKNLKLSINRANSVKEYLITQGVDGTILKAKGFGASQPITSNDTKEGRLRNRRVVFKIIKP